jgi:hypothetical protein
VDTEKLREHLEIVEPHLLSVNELLQMLVPTNSIYPIYAKEGKGCERELGRAINAFVEMKKEVGLSSNLTPTIPEDELPGASGEMRNIDAKKLRDHLDIVETSIHFIIENIHMINAAQAIYPIYKREGIQCETELAGTMNALLELKKVLDLYSVSEQTKVVEQLSRKEVQCTSTAELLVNWQCPLCQADLSTTLGRNKDETEACLISKPHYGIPVEAQECPALIFYVTYRQPEINVVASIPKQ